MASNMLFVLFISFTFRKCLQPLVHGQKRFPFRLFFFVYVRADQWLNSQRLVIVIAELLFDHNPNKILYIRSELLNIWSDIQLLCEM